MVKWLLLLLISAPAMAYEFTIDFKNGFYWANLPISISVSEGNANRKAKLETLSKSAISVWEQSTGLKIWDYSSGTRNVIRWSTNFEAETRMSSSTTLAVAIRYTSGPYFAKTEIVLNGNHPMLDDSRGFSTDSAVFKTLIHELGHTMGLDHDQWNQNAVMYPSLDTVHFVRLDSSDIDGMQAAHQQMMDWQLERYVSPLAYENNQVSSSPMSCASAGLVAQGGSGLSGLASLIGGILISFIRKIKSLFK